MIKWLELMLAVLFSFAAQLFIKFASLHSSRKYFLLGLSILFYGLAFVSFYFANKKLPLTVVGPVGTIAVTMLIFGASVLVIKEPATNTQIIGLLFGVVSILLLIAGSSR